MWFPLIDLIGDIDTFKKLENNCFRLDQQHSIVWTRKALMPSSDQMLIIWNSLCHLPENSHHSHIFVDDRITALTNAQVTLYHCLIQQHHRGSCYLTGNPADLAARWQPYRPSYCLTFTSLIINKCIINQTKRPCWPLSPSTNTCWHL